MVLKNYNVIFVQIVFLALFPKGPEYRQLCPEQIMQQAVVVWTGEQIMQQAVVVWTG